ncbi:phosphate/phosphite/phosphonate ABC transporter substrate-binding protein [Serratia liquefaciens]
MQVSLPMYGVTHQPAESFWRVLRGKLLQLGLPLAPEQLVWPHDLAQHWLQDNLLLSQTCGYPLVSSLPQVQLIGTYHYRVEGCEGANYSSWLVVRADDPGERLADFRGRTAAYNSTDSQSGHNSLRALIAPLAQNGRFFGAAVASGAHYQSLRLIQNRQADIAAVDCVSLELLKRAQPEALAGLKIIGRTASVPGLPLITSSQTPPEQLEILRAGAKAMLGEAVSDNLLIGDFSLVPRSAYQIITELEQQAAARGVTAL